MSKMQDLTQFVWHDANYLALLCLAVLGQRKPNQK